MWILKIENYIFYKLLRRYVKRLSISHLESFMSWFGLDLIIKRRGLERWKD